MELEGHEWVVDTWVLETAQNFLDHRNLGAISFLNEVLQRHHIAVDNQGEILKEYRAHFRWPSPASKWWQLMTARAGKIQFRDGKLARHWRFHLLNVLNLDPSDIKFVAVASKGVSKYLVSEDSDYNDAVRAYLTSDLGITTFTVSDALSKALGT